MAISQVGLPTTGSASVGNGAVYWIGNDGNIYLKGAPGVSGVANLGQAPSSLGIDNNANNGYGITADQINLPGANYAATLIANPSNGAAASGSGSSTGVSQSTIQAILDSIAQNVANNQTAYNTAKAQNAADDANEQGQYNQQVQTNTGNRANAIQNAEQAAASGNQGLRAVLASLGALNGTGSVLAGRAVADSANNDIGTADNTYTTNNAAITAADKDYQNQRLARDTALDTSLTNDNNSVNNQGYQQILNDASSKGDTATYNQFLPKLVSSIVPTAPLAHAPLVFQNTPLSAYAPTSSVNVKAAPAANPAAATAAVIPVNSALYVKKTS